jgi:tetratricopeptide (TPR) repeat protein
MVPFEFIEDLERMDRIALGGKCQLITYKILLFKIWLSADRHSEALDVLARYPKAIEDINRIFAEDIPSANSGSFVDNSIVEDVIRRVRYFVAIAEIRAAAKQLPEAEAALLIADRLARDARTDADYLDRRGEYAIVEVNWTMSKVVRGRQQVALAMGDPALALGLCWNQFEFELDFDDFFLQQYRDYPDFMRIALVQDPLERRNSLISFFERDGVVIPARYMDGVANFFRALVQIDNDDSDTDNNVHLLDAVIGHFVERFDAIGQSSRRIEYEHEEVVGRNLYQLAWTKVMIESANAPRFAKLKLYRDFLDTYVEYVSVSDSSVIDLKKKTVNFMREIVSADNLGEDTIAYVEDYARELTSIQFAEIKLDDFSRIASTEVYLVLAQLSLRKGDLSNFILFIFKATYVDIDVGRRGEFDSDISTKIDNVMKGLRDIRMGQSLIYQELLVLDTLKACSYDTVVSVEEHSLVTPLKKLAQQKMLVNFEGHYSYLKEILSSSEAKEDLQELKNKFFKRKRVNKTCV